VKEWGADPAIWSRGRLGRFRTAKGLLALPCHRSTQRVSAVANSGFIPRDYRFCGFGGSLVEPANPHRMHAGQCRGNPVRELGASSG